MQITSSVSQKYLRTHPHYGTNWFVISYSKTQREIVLWHYAIDHGHGKPL